MVFVLGALHSAGHFESIGPGYSAGDERGLVVGTGAYLFASGAEQRTWRLWRVLKRLFRLQGVRQAI